MPSSACCSFYPTFRCSQWLLLCSSSKYLARYQCPLHYHVCKEHIVWIHPTCGEKPSAAFIFAQYKKRKTFFRLENHPLKISHVHENTFLNTHFTIFTVRSIDFLFGMSLVDGAAVHFRLQQRKMLNCWESSDQRWTVTKYINTSTVLLYKFEILVLYVTVSVSCYCKL